MPRSRTKILEVAVNKEGYLIVPDTVKDKLQLKPGDKLFACIFDATLQISKVSPRLALPVLGREVEEFDHTGLDD